MIEIVCGVLMFLQRRGGGGGGDKPTLGVDRALKTNYLHSLLRNQISDS